MKRALRNTSRQAPLTPRIPEPAPAPTAPTVAANIRIEKILFDMYMAEKDRADWAMERYRNSEKRFDQFRLKGFVRGVAKNFRPREAK